MNFEDIQRRIEEYEPDSKFIPLKITVGVTTPICIAHPWINFDGLLAHMLLRKVLGDDYRALPSKAPLDVSKLRLPIKEYENDMGSFYHTSVSIFDTTALYTTTIYKRFHTGDIATLPTIKKKIRRGSGQFRDFMISLVYIPSNSVIFYVNGNKKEIEELLKGLPGLGKKTAIGFGSIKNISVEKVKNDYSLVNGKGKAMRPIPEWALKEYSESVRLAYTFPYWYGKNVDFCAPYGADIIMR